MSVAHDNPPEKTSGAPEGRHEAWPRSKPHTGPTVLFDCSQKAHTQSDYEHEHEYEHACPEPVEGSRSTSTPALSSSTSVTVSLSNCSLYHPSKGARPALLLSALRPPPSAF